MNVSTSKLQGEWVYKDIHPRIIVEKLMKDTEDGDLKDYKFFVLMVRCFVLRWTSDDSQNIMPIIIMQKVNYCRSERLFVHQTLIIRFQCPQFIPDDYPC